MPQTPSRQKETEQLLHKKVREPCIEKKARGIHLQDKTCIDFALAVRSEAS